MATTPIIPSKTWYPTTLAARLAWWVNFAGLWPTYSAGLGLASFDNQVSKDNDDYQSIGATRLAVENFRSAMATFMRDLCEVAVGSPDPVFPTETFTAPPNGQPAGFYQRLIELRTLIMAQPTYTKTIGAALGIEPTTPTVPDAATVKPTAVYSGAVHGYHFGAMVSGREAADQWQVWTRVEGTEKWQLAATAVGKTVDVTYDPGEATGAVILEVYIQLRKNNADYGQPSEIGLVTVNP